MLPTIVVLAVGLPHSLKSRAFGGLSKKLLALETEVEGDADELAVTPRYATSELERDDTLTAVKELKEQVRKCRKTRTPEAECNAALQEELNKEKPGGGDYTGAELKKAVQDVLTSPKCQTANLTPLWGDKQKGIRREPNGRVYYQNELVSADGSEDKPYYPVDCTVRVDDYKISIPKQALRAYRRNAGDMWQSMSKTKKGYPDANGWKNCGWSTKQGDGPPELDDREAMFDIFWLEEEAKYSDASESPYEVVIQSVTTCWDKSGYWAQACSKDSWSHGSAAVMLTLGWLKNRSATTTAKSVFEDALGNKAVPKNSYAGEAIYYGGVAGSSSYVWLDCPMLGVLGTDAYSYGVKNYYPGTKCLAKAEAFKDAVAAQISYVGEEKRKTVPAIFQSAMRAWAPLISVLFDATAGTAQVYKSQIHDQVGGKSQTQTMTGDVDGKQVTMTGSIDISKSDFKSQNALDENDAHTAGQNLAANIDPEGYLKNAVITKASINLFMSTAGCVLGGVVTVASAGASAPMAIVGCARMMASLLRFTTTYIDTFSKERHMPENIIAYVAIQNEFVEAIDNVLARFKDSQGELKIRDVEATGLNKAAVNGIFRFSCAVGAMKTYADTFKLSTGGEPVRQEVSALEEDAILRVKELKDDVMGAFALETMDVAKQTLTMTTSVQEKLLEIEQTLAEVIAKQNSIEPKIDYVHDQMLADEGSAAAQAFDPIWDPP